MSGSPRWTLGLAALAVVACGDSGAVDPGDVGLDALDASDASDATDTSQPECDEDADDSGFEVLFDGRTVPRFYLTIPAASWDVMAACEGGFGEDRPPECDYQPAMFHAVFDPSPDEGSCRVTTSDMAVGLRRKGRVTWRELAPPDPDFTGKKVVNRGGKPSLKVRFGFEGGERFLGLSRLTLNNSRQDPSAIRERLGFAAYRAAGVTAPLANSAEVFVKGPDDADFVRWGLYVNLQSLDKVFVRSRFGEVDGEIGNVYDTHNDQYFTDLDRCANRDQAGEAPGAQEARFALETNESEGDTSDLTAAIDAVYEPAGIDAEHCKPASFNADQLLADVEPALDVDAFLREYAVAALIANWDGHAGARNNYVLYHELARDRFVLIPWGLDQTFGWQDQVHYPNWHYALSHEDSHRKRALLMRRCEADATGCWPRYLQHVEDVTDLLSEADLQAEAANMGVQVRDLIDWTDAEFDRHQSFVEQFLATRLECVAALLDGDPCDPLACTTDSDTCDPAAGM